MGKVNTWTTVQETCSWCHDFWVNISYQITRTVIRFTLVAQSSLNLLLRFTVKDICKNEKAKAKKEKSSNSRQRTNKKQKV